MTWPAKQYLFQTCLVISSQVQTNVKLRQTQFVSLFTPKGSPFDKWSRLALDRVKSFKSLLGVKGLRAFVYCQNGQNQYPIYDQNSWKTRPFWAPNTYMENIREKPLPSEMLSKVNPVTNDTYRIHYPLPLPYVGKPDPVQLQETIRKLREENQRLKEQVSVGRSFSCFS